MNNNEKLIELEKRILTLETKPKSLSYPMNSLSNEVFKKALDDFLPEKIFNATWNNYFHFTTFFESLDGFGSVGTAPTNDAGAYVSMTVTASGEVSGLEKSPARQKILRWDKYQRFKTSFRVSNVTNVKAIIAVGGERGGGTSETGFGFELSDSTLYCFSTFGYLLISSSTNASPIEITTASGHGLKTGDTVIISGHAVNTAANGFWTIIVTASNKFTLTGSTGNGVGVATGTASPKTRINSGLTIPAQTDIEVEARFMPQVGIIFLVDNVASSGGVFSNLKEVGRIVSNLPDSKTSSISNSAVHSKFFNVWVQANEASPKVLTISYFDFIQKK